MPTVFLNDLAEATIFFFAVTLHIINQDERNNNLLFI